MKDSLRLALLIIFCVNCFSIIAYAQANAPSARSLKSGVQKVEFSLEKLREVDVDLKRMLKSATNLNEEVTIQPMSLVTQPDVVAGNIVNLPVAVQAAGEFMPPRKEKVNEAMRSLRPMVAQLKADADAFVANTNQLDLTVGVSAQLGPRLKEWGQVVNRLAKEELRLEQLTAGPGYDNEAIGRITGFIQNDIKKLEANRKDIYKVICKQEKAESKRSASK
jgi:hypothetical protein